MNDGDKTPMKGVDQAYTRKQGVGRTLASLTGECQCNQAKTGRGCREARWEGKHAPWESSLDAARLNSARRPIFILAADIQFAAARPIEAEGRSVHGTEGDDRREGSGHAPANAGAKFFGACLAV